MKRKLFTYYVCLEGRDVIGWRKTAKAAGEFAATLVDIHETIYIVRKPRKSGDFSY